LQVFPLLPYAVRGLSATFYLYTSGKIMDATLFFPGATQPIVVVYFTAFYWALASSRTRLLDHTQRRATVGRSPLNE